MDYLILIDRQIDPLTPLVTQLTYEGLIDEFYGIHNSKLLKSVTRVHKENHTFQLKLRSVDQVKLPEDKFGETKVFMLNSGEELYTELRDKNFSAIGGILRAKTAEIQEIMRQKERGNMSVGEMKRLVQNLPTIQALKQSLSTRR